MEGFKNLESSLLLVYKIHFPLFLDVSVVIRIILSIHIIRFEQL